ncbi:MAG: N-acetyltransferase family protein [Haloferacaceae archaeon]
MTSERIYPEEPSGPFEDPPVEFTDADGREVVIREYEPGDRDALVAMYGAFDPADRAQGIPPSDERRIAEWLDHILTEDCLNVVAWHGTEAAGHATLVPDGESYELAIFVLQDYQRAGIGTRLLKALLGYGQRAGVEKVWLTVERWNRAAVSLYKKVGFETCDAESFELEMAIRIGDDSD